MANGGYETSFYPYLYIESPSYLHSAEIQCHIRIGNYTSVSNWCDLKIIRNPILDHIPTVRACINDGSLVLSAVSQFYGTYDKVQ
jgi:hypothetical protein